MTPESGNLYTICYTSQASLDFSDEDISALVEHASEANATLSITGLLCFHNNQFFQYLEGPEAEVTQLMGLIYEDERHSIRTILDMPGTAQRRCANRSMLRVRSSSRNLTSLIESMIRLCGDAATFQSVASGQTHTRGTERSIQLLQDCVSRASMIIS